MNKYLNNQINKRKKREQVSLKVTFIITILNVNYFYLYTIKINDLNIEIIEFR